MTETTEKKSKKIDDTQKDDKIRDLIMILFFVTGIALGAIVYTPPFQPVNTNWGFLREFFTQLGLAMTLTSVTFFIIDRHIEKGNQKHIERIIRINEEHIQSSERHVRDTAKTIKNSLKESLNDLKEQGDILKLAAATHIVKIYAKREEGQQDIIDDLKTSQSIKMMGISLREYLLPPRGSASNFHHQMRRILEDIVKNPKRKIQILLINPYCDQATIRAERETWQNFDSDKKYEMSALYLDVRSSIAAMKDLEKDVINSRIETRVYDTAPTCFLIITDKYVYIEQYHYGLFQPGQLGGNFPMLKFSRVHIEPDSLEHTTTEYLEKHFDYIWEKRIGTIPIKDFSNEHNIGVSKVAWECGLSNMFIDYDNELAKERIKYVLSLPESSIQKQSNHLPETPANKQIKLIGVSLRDFFYDGDGFYSAIERIDQQGVTIRVLLLDPKSVQSQSNKPQEEQNQNLFHEVENVKTGLKRLAKNVRQKGITIKLRVYKTPVNYFAILTPKSVIVEQNFFGLNDIGDPLGTAIRGGKAPVFEYVAGKPMYDELNNHFEYIWETATEEALDD